MLDIPYVRESITPVVPSEWSQVAIQEREREREREEKKKKKVTNASLTGEKTPYSAYLKFSANRLVAEIITYRAIEPNEEITISCTSLTFLLSYSQPVFPFFFFFFFYFFGETRFLVFFLFSLFSHQTKKLTKKTDTPLATKHIARRDYLAKNYGIDCHCTLCRATELDRGDSEVRRRRMHELQETVTHARGEKYFQDAINIAHEWAEFADMEELHVPAPEFDFLIAELYLAKGDLAPARRYARMALDRLAEVG
jgi:hypothetical protein